MTSIIPDSPAIRMGINALWEKSTFELDKSKKQHITLEVIQNLSPEQKETALYKFCKIVEASPTLCESFALNQVLYRIISGNTFTESATSVAQRTGCDRKTILKGLAQAVEQNILLENKRSGTSNEYSFKPVEEWKPKPARVHSSPALATPSSVLDSPRVRKLDTPKVIPFPSTDNPETPVETLLVQNLDNLQTDPNNVIVVNKILNKQQLEVSVPILDTPSIWLSLPDGNRYAQIPPIYDQGTGVEIQRQMEQEGLTAQKVVGRAIALSKVPLMLLELWAAIGSKLTNSSLKAPVEAVVSLQLSKTLETLNINLSEQQLHKCVTQYGEDVMLKAANELKRTGVLANKENPTGYFLGCLKNGMGQNSAVEQLCEQQEQEHMKLNDATTEMGQALKKPVKSFSHVETNPRVTIAALIMDGQYQRAAIMSGLYGVDYKELVSECGLADDPETIILLRKVTRSSP